MSFQKTCKGTKKKAYMQIFSTFFRKKRSVLYVDRLRLVTQRLCLCLFLRERVEKISDYLLVWIFARLGE